MKNVNTSIIPSFTLAFLRKNIMHMPITSADIYHDDANEEPKTILAPSFIILSPIFPAKYSPKYKKRVPKL